MNLSASHLQRALDAAMDDFERHWTVTARDRILQIAGHAPVELQPLIVVELVRADIGRRYASGADVRLAEYFQLLPGAFASVVHCQTVAFEDFRCRQVHGRTCQPDRWRGIPGIESQEWYKELAGIDPPSGYFQVPSPAAASWRFAAGDSPSVMVPAAQATHEHPGAGLRPGTVLGDFRIVGVIGEGSFSVVYLARQISLAERFVAIKVVTRPLGEPAFLGRMQHTGIVPLYSCHRAAGRWILCMPYSGPSTLADWLRSTPAGSLVNGQSFVETLRAAQTRVASLSRDSATNLSMETRASDSRDTQSLQAWHQAAGQSLEMLTGLSGSRLILWLAVRIASALTHAHERGIVHGDLKPANILIRNDGEPALIDFNLSQRTSGDGETARGGTLPYLPAEQLQAWIEGKGESLRPQVDVFALGVILFEIAERRLPFPAPASRATTDLEQCVRLRSQCPVFAPRNGCSAGLHAIILKCLALQPNDRYPSGRELLADLEAEWNSQPLQHAHESFFRSRLPKAAARYPRLFSGGGILLLCAFLLSVLAYVAWQFRTDSLRLAALNARQQFVEESEAIVADCLTSDVASPLSKQISPIQRAIQAMESLLGDQPGSHGTFARMTAALSAEQRSDLEQRLVATAYLPVKFQRRKSAAAESEVTRQELTGRLQELLPDHLRRHEVFLSLPPTADVAGAGNAAIQPVTSTGRILLAAAATATRQSADALQLLDSVPPDDALSLIFWLTRARAQADSGQFRDAVFSFTMALRDQPDSATIRLNRGLAWYRLSAFDQALKDYSDALEYAPDLIPALVNRSALHNRAGRKDAALADLTTAVGLNPDSPQLLLMRARLLRESGRIREADEDFRKAVSVPPKTAADWVSVALARLPGDAEQALSDLQKAETLNGPETMILQSMAHVLSEHLHRQDEAVACLDRLLALDAGFDKALCGRAVLHARAGRVERTLEDLAALHVKGPALTPEALYQMACAYALLSRQRMDFRDEALHHLARAVRGGYGGELLDADTDLDGIRNAPEFSAVRTAFQLLSLSSTSVPESAGQR